MTADFYVKVVLTVIAGCLIALTLSNSVRGRAAERTTCHGDLKATATSNPIQASIGGNYKIDVVCE